MSAELSLPYVAAALLIAGAITFALRALPFSMLEPLRESRLVTVMASWMPAGILAILALVTFRDSVGGTAQGFLTACIAAAVTVIVHLAAGRRTLLSVGLGTLTYVALVNLA